MRNILFAAAMVTASLNLAAPAHADVIVVTPNVNEAQAGTNNVNSPFGAAGNANRYVLQTQYAASMFSGLEIGSRLTSVGFRLALGSATNATALNYDDFTVQVGSGAHALGGLSRTFTDNLGADTIVARTGALTFAKGELKADACTSSRCRPRVPVNSFFTIDLTVPYTYTGGDLMLTFSSLLAAGTVGKIVALDAVDPYRVTSLNTVSTSGVGSVSTRGNVNFAYAPIMQFTFAPPLPPAAVPEPGSLALMLSSLVFVGAGIRRRRARGRPA